MVGCITELGAVRVVEGVGLGTARAAGGVELSTARAARGDGWLVSVRWTGTTGGGVLLLYGLKGIFSLSAGIFPTRLNQVISLGKTAK